jgi:hypothetical protein
MSDVEVVQEKGLTVSELSILMAEARRQGLGTRQVRVQIERGTVGMGSSHFVDVMDAHAGFDLDSRTMILGTSEPLGIAGKALETLKNNSGRAVDAMYWIESIMEDDRYSEAAKLDAIASRIAQFREGRG